MIASLRFSNFYSFANEVDIDFTLGKQPTPSGYDIPFGEGRVNKVIAVVGANGSGKTQLIKPFAFLSWFLCDSFPRSNPDHDLPYSAHALYLDKSTQFSLSFVLDDESYRYDLTLLRGRVLSEALFKKTSSRYSYIFKREKTDKGFSFEHRGFPFEKTDLADNASVIAAAHSYDLKEAEIFTGYFKGIFTNVEAIGRREFSRAEVFRAARYYDKMPELKANMVKAMTAFDLGLRDIEIEKSERPTEDGKMEILYLPWGVHSTEKGEHFRLPFLSESSGTQSAFSLLRYLLPVLHTGGIAVIDELDNDLHPHLIPEILDWFGFEHTNPHQAQLIFTCHTPEVLNLLQKHQVYLVEKEEQCSDAWRVDSVGGLVRSDDNLYAKYMAGALGATPDL